MDKVDQKKSNQILVGGLRKAIELHKSENYTALYALFHEISSEVSSIKEELNKETNIALNFLDSWGDSGGHDWLFYEGINKDDWPHLADEITEALESGEEITNPLILKHFDLVPRVSIWRRIKGMFGHKVK